MRDKEERVRAAGGQVIAVAVSSIFAQQAFGRHLGVNFPLLSDWNRTVSPAYGVQYDVWRGHQGVAKRSVFVIDRQGLIRYRWVTDDALVLPDFDAAIAVLQQPIAFRRRLIFTEAEPLRRARMPVEARL